MPEIMWILAITLLALVGLNFLLTTWLKYVDNKGRKALARGWLQEMQDNHDGWIHALSENPQRVAILSKDEIIGDVEYHFGQRARLEFVMQELGKK